MNCILEFHRGRSTINSEGPGLWNHSNVKSLQLLGQWSFFIQSSLLPEIPLKLAVMGSNASLIPKAEKTVFRSKRL